MHNSNKSISAIYLCVKQTSRHLLAIVIEKYEWFFSFSSSLRNYLYTVFMITHTEK